MTNRLKRQLLYFAEAIAILVFWAVLYFWLIIMCAGVADAQMQTARIVDPRFEATAATAAGGQPAALNGIWWNSTGQNVYIWGIQADLWTNMAIPPGDSGDAVMGAGWSFYHYLTSIADMNIQVYTNAGVQLYGRGSDHYDNSPTLNPGPVFFPRPFTLPPGQAVTMQAHASNGYQTTYGGSFTLNADVLVYYTVGTP